MSSRFPEPFSALILAALLAAACAPSDKETKAAAREVAATDARYNAASGTRVLRVCSDPNNLPFSNQRQEGFENRIADVLASEIGARVEYTWWAQRRGFIRNTLRADLCDVVMGIPTGFELVLPTKPYYRSTYVFVTRPGQASITSFDDPRLRTTRVGVQLIGDDGTNTPPAHALSRRGIIQNVSGYMVYGDYREENPPARIIDAVARGEIDVAVAWGPLAGYFAKRGSTELSVVPVSPQIDLPYLPFVFDISIGVRRTDVALRDELDRALVARRAEIDAILDEYHVPRAGSRVQHPRS